MVGDFILFLEKELAWNLWADKNVKTKMNLLLRISRWKYFLLRDHDCSFWDVFVRNFDT